MEQLSKLAWIIDELVSKPKVMARFRKMVLTWYQFDVECGKSHDAWKKKDADYRERVRDNERLRDEAAGPPEPGWELRHYIIRPPPEGKLVMGWTPPEIYNWTEPEFRSLLPIVGPVSFENIRRPYKLHEKYVVLAVIHDYFCSPPQVPVDPWKTTDAPIDDGFRRKETCFPYAGLLDTIELLPFMEHETNGANLPAIQAFLRDVKNDLAANSDTLIESNHLHDVIQEELDSQPLERSERHIPPNIEDIPEFMPPDPLNQVFWIARLLDAATARASAPSDPDRHWCSFEGIHRREREYLAKRLTMAFGIANQIRSKPLLKEARQAVLSATGFGLPTILKRLSDALDGRFNVITGFDEMDALDQVCDPPNLVAAIIIEKARIASSLLKGMKRKPSAKKRPDSMTAAKKKSSRTDHKRRKATKSKSPGWKRLRIRETKAGAIAILDGSNYLLRGIRDHEFLIAMKNAKGEPLKASSLEKTLGERPSRIFKRLPKQIQRIISKPERGSQGYFLK